jgi:type I restriction enzyme, R subunit
VEEHGLTPDEVAFYDALAEIDNEQLRLIAQLLLNKLQSSITVDGAHRESAQAKLRMIVKDLLEGHGYPPDLSPVAVQLVLQQAEALSARWRPMA